MSASDHGTISKFAERGYDPLCAQLGNTNTKNLHYPLPQAWKTSQPAVFGPSLGHNSAVVNAGVSVQWTPAISTYVSYDGQLGRTRYDSNGVSGGFESVSDD